MGNFIAIAVAIGIGGLMALQSALNTNLGRSVGVYEAAFISFLGGTITLLLVMLGLGQGKLSNALDIPKYLWLGGVLGAIVVTGIIFLIPIVGVAGTMTAAIAGQLIIALLFDHFGWLGVSQDKITIVKLVGVGVLLLGVKLITKG